MIFQGPASIVNTYPDGSHAHVSGAVSGYNMMNGQETGAITYFMDNYAQKQYVQLSTSDDFVAVFANDLVVNGGIGDDIINNFSTSTIRGGLGHDTNNIS